MKGTNILNLTTPLPLLLFASHNFVKRELYAIRQTYEGLVKHSLVIITVSWIIPVYCCCQITHILLKMFCQPAFLL